MHEISFVHQRLCGLNCGQTIFEPKGGVKPCVCQPDAHHIGFVEGIWKLPHTKQQRRGRELGWVRILHGHMRIERGAQSGSQGLYSGFAQLSPSGPRPLSCGGQDWYMPSGVCW